MLSLKENSALNFDHELFEQVHQLQNYSNSCFDKATFKYKHFHNVKNIYLKSLLISKFLQANMEQLHCRFECPNPVNNIPIAIFDCVRILGIVL